MPLPQSPPRSPSGAVRGHPGPNVQLPGKPSTTRGLPRGLARPGPTFRAVRASSARFAVRLSRAPAERAITSATDRPVFEVALLIRPGSGYGLELWPTNGDQVHQVHHLTWRREGPLMPERGRARWTGGSQTEGRMANTGKALPRPTLHCGLPTTATTLVPEKAISPDVCTA